MIRTILILGLVTALPACSLLWPDRGNLQFDGTVTYTELEGGAWVIEGEDGKTYEPINLDEEYREEGLRVRVWAEERTDLASVLMVGPIIEIKRIRVLGRRNGISIALTPTELVITNDTQDEVFTQAVGRRISALVNLCHCVKEGSGLPPGEQERIPRGDILLHHEGEEEITVYWWHGVTVDGSYVPGELHHEIVPL